MGHKKQKSQRKQSTPPGITHIGGITLRGVWDDGAKPKPKTPQQQHAAEFRRSVKDCSTAELNYRLSVNDNQRADTEVSIIDAQYTLTASRKRQNTLTREHDVLMTEIEGRR